MKRSILSLVAAATLLIGSSAFAEPGVVDSTNTASASNIEMQKHGTAPKIVVSQSELGVNTDVYEAQQDKTTNALNVAAVEMGNLLTMGYTAKSQASTIGLI